MTRLNGRELEEEFLDIARGLGGDVAGRVSGDAYLRTTHALYHGEPAPWAFTPKIFDDAQFAILKGAAETMGHIMDKVTECYLRDAGFRKRFGFTQTMEDLTLVPAGYSRLIPLARVDVFFNEQTGDFSFCELNTDGSAGMTNTAEITEAIAQSPTYAEFSRRHPTTAAFDVRGGCMQAILDTYGVWCGTRGEGPESLAVVDYADAVSADEVQDFVERFEKLGVRARFADIRDLTIVSVDGRERLVDAQGPIDCVWRRAVTCDIEARPGEGVDALVEATREGLVCTVGGFRTWPCATKTVFVVMSDPDFKQQLTADEATFVEKHVPETHLLAPSADLDRYAEKDRWIIKPSGGYNAVGVLAGLDCSLSAWEKRLRLGAQNHDVIQAYAPQYATPTLRGGIAAHEDPTASALANNMEGLYLFDGKFGGVFTRCGQAHTIGEFTGRLNMGCFVVHE